MSVPAVQSIYTYFTTLQHPALGLIPLVTVSAVAISISLQACKPAFKKLEARYGLEVHKLIITLLAVLSFAVSVGYDYLSAKPPENLGAVTSVSTYIFTACILLYHWSLSPSYKHLTKYLRDVDNHLSQDIGVPADPAQQSS